MGRKGSQEQYAPEYATPPGWSLRSRIEAMGMTQAELSIRAGLAEKTVSQIINGEAPITVDVANRLELVIGTPARVWNNMERIYRERLGKQAERQRFERDVAWAREFPLRQLRSRGIISAASDKAQQVLELLRFFAVSRRESWERLWTVEPKAALRRSPLLMEKPKLTATWLRLVQLNAESVQCEGFDKRGFKEALGVIKGMTREAPEAFVPRMQSQCAKAGVAVVFVKEFKGAGINGACMWHADRPVIGMTLRGRWSDIFWFTFFHEAGHLLMHGKKDMFVDTGKEKKDTKEREADSFATHLLIPGSDAVRLPRLVAGGDMANRVRAFARQIGVHSGIVVGRLQHDGLLPASHLNGLKERLVWREH